MGTSASRASNTKPTKEEGTGEPWVPPVYDLPNPDADVVDSGVDVANQEQKPRSAENEQKMKVFYDELAEKRRQRNEIIAEKADEMKNLRQLVGELKDRIGVLENENEGLKGGEAKEEQPQPSGTINIEKVRSEMLKVIEERNNLKKQIEKYKIITHHTKTMLQIRDEELAQLKAKMVEIEASLEKFQNGAENEELRAEYERQLENIKKLKILYEKRGAELIRKQIQSDREILEYKTSLEAQTKKTTGLESEIEELNAKLLEKQNMLIDVENQLDLSKAKAKKYQQELLVLNKLFSQALCGTNKKDEIDIDQLIVFLDQNRDLISDLTASESEETNAMQQVLCELMQANKVPKNGEMSEPNEKDDENAKESCDNVLDDKNLTQADQKASNKIDKSNQGRPDVSKLLKLWRMLMELLTHQNVVIKTQDVPEMEQINGAVPKKRGSACYKSVQTAAGPKLVLSVSKTYIRLKDLILEKKALQKEMARLNQLYAYIEARFSSQQRRLANVSSELTHTWCLAGRMQKSYKTLHSHEQILRYELKQKRKMLNGLKQELQLCREKWQQAKEKNSESELEWKRLRSEFASRKLLNQTDDCCSAESGYSDERSDESDMDSKEIVSEFNNKNNDSVEKEKLMNETKKDLVDLTNSVEKPTDTKNDVILILNKVDTSACTNSGNANSTENVSELTQPSTSITSDKTSLDTSLSENTGNSIQTLADILATKDLVQNSTTENNKPAASGESSQSKDSLNIINSNSSEESAIDASCSKDAKSNIVEQVNSQTSNNSTASTSSNKQTPAEILSSRDARLRQMEEQCKQLVSKVTKTSHRSKELCCRLEELHEQYGRDDQASGSRESEKPAKNKDKETTK